MRIRSVCLWEILVCVGGERRGGRTAQRCDGGAGGLDEDAVVGNLEAPGQRKSVPVVYSTGEGLTGCSVLASSKIQPSSITSADSFVT